MKPIYKYNNKNSAFDGQFVEIIKFEEKASKVRFIELSNVRDAWVPNSELELIEDVGTGLNRVEKLQILAIVVGLIGLVYFAFVLAGLIR